MIKSFIVPLILIITLNPAHGEEANTLSEDTNKFLCSASAAMTYEATRMRDKGIIAEKAEKKLETMFLKGENSRIKVFLSFAVDHAYKLNEFNEVTNYTLWLAACTIQLVHQRRNSIDFKYKYISMVKDKIKSCENQNQSKKQIDECVLNIIMPALRHG